MNKDDGSVKGARGQAAGRNIQHWKEGGKKLQHWGAWGGGDQGFKVFVIEERRGGTKCFGCQKVEQSQTHGEHFLTNLLRAFAL